MQCNVISYYYDTWGTKVNATPHSPGDTVLEFSDREYTATCQITYFYSYCKSYYLYVTI